MWFVVFSLGLALLSQCNSYDWDEPTALDAYVNHDDGAYSYTELDSYRFEDDRVTVHVLYLTSQYWMDESFSDSPLWWHHLVIAIPDVIRRDFAYMFIEGGSNNPPSEPPGMGSGEVFTARELAAKTGYVAAILRQVPNQGIVFANDPDRISRTEDDFISWTWKTFIETHQDQPEVLARMPMTKSGTRALDAIHDFVLEQRPANNINQFAVGGGSKRGWTAWSVAAMDRRVVAVTPMVMSLMNFNDTLQAHYRNLGGWTFTFYDYWEKGLTRHFHDDIVTNWDYGLFTYEDMFRYKERLEPIPKLLISASGDQFFLATDSHTWWEQMGGPKWIMMNPNAGHGLDTVITEVFENVAAWLLLTMEDLLPPVPQLVWLRGQTANGARILLSVDIPPDDVTAWVAHSTRTHTRKDFRLHSGFPPQPQDVEWTKFPVINTGPGIYDVEVPTDLPGYAAVYIETIYTRLVPGATLRLTTEVQVTPDTYPFEGCYGADCFGSMV